MKNRSLTSSCSITVNTSAACLIGSVAQGQVILDTNVIKVIGGIDQSDGSGGLRYNACGGVEALPEPARYAGLFGVDLMTSPSLRHEQK